MGANTVCADDNKGLKGAVLGWVTSLVNGLVPPIPHMQMSGCGFNHEATGKQLCPASLDWNDPQCASLYLCVSAHLTDRYSSIKSSLKVGTMIVQSDQWPIFIYLHGVYDPEDPWKGLLRGRLLMNVSFSSSGSL